MILEILRNLSHKDVKELPSWVSKKNITFKVYQCINELRLARLSYIASHNKVSHYKTKKMYQISASEVAQKVGCATSTLICTSAYSKELKCYLDKINQGLLEDKEKKLSKHKKTLASGMKQRKKDEITKELQATKKELDLLKSKNAEEQVLLVLKALPLPVKHKLGID